MAKLTQMLVPLTRCAPIRQDGKVRSIAMESVASAEQAEIAVHDRSLSFRPKAARWHRAAPAPRQGEGAASCSHMDEHDAEGSTKGRAERVAVARERISNTQRRPATPRSTTTRREERLFLVDLRMRKFAVQQIVLRFTRVSSSMSNAARRPGEASRH
jgi:hypothetical protein